MTRFLLIFGYFALFLSTRLNAVVEVWGEKTIEASILPEASIVIDESRQLTAEAIFAGELPNTMFPFDVVNQSDFGYSDANFWVYIEVKNSDSEPLTRYIGSKDLIFSYTTYTRNMEK